MGKDVKKQLKWPSAKIAAYIALFTGCFGLFGLGHFYLSRFVRGLVFLALGIFGIYFVFAGAALLFPPREAALMGYITLYLLFFFQLSDAYYIGRDMERAKKGTKNLGKLDDIRWGGIIIVSLFVIFVLMTTLYPQSSGNSGSVPEVPAGATISVDELSQRMWSYAGDHVVLIGEVTEVAGIENRIRGEVRYVTLIDIPQYFVLSGQRAKVTGYVTVSGVDWVVDVSQIENWS